MKRKALGKGLDALLGAPPPPATGLTQIPIERIHPNSFQPRVQFERSALEELAASIRENGVLQPIIVRQAGGEYELVAGERRWRAAQLAELPAVPALVQDLSDEKVLEVALVENIQRAELSAIEEAQAYKLLVDEFGLEQKEIARRVGRSRVAVSNTLRLLKLPQNIQAMVVAGEVSMGHARALLSLPVKHQQSLAREVQKKGLSVRQVERRAATLLNPPPKKTKKVDPNTRAAAQRLEDVWKTKVEILRSGKGGRVVLHFHSEEELERLYESLLGPKP